jgi:hypothetical protein
VVAVLAVVSTYYPLSGKFIELNSKMQASVDNDRKLKSLISTNPNMPVVDPKSNEVKPLGMFPTDKVIEKGKQVVGKVHTESEKLAAKALEINERKPLVPGALPSGGGRYLAEFKDAYYSAMADLRAQMDATTVPTQEEINAKIEQIWTDDFKPMIKTVGDTAQNEQEVRAEFEDFKKDVPKQMRLERAMKHVMYVNPEKQGATPGTTNGMTTSFDYHQGIPALDARDLPNIVDVWCAQLGYWVQEDIVRAIVETNKDSKDVDHSIVKRLIRTEIKKEYLTSTGPIQIAMALNAANIPPAAPDAAGPNGPPKAYGYSVTGRVCNPQYDVMHFTITVDADAQRFQTFLNNLTRSKFVTILKINMRGVDRERIQQSSYYYYGKSPVVRLENKGETIFLRAWTAPPADPTKGLMPANVQKLLGIRANPTGVADAR